MRVAIPTENGFVSAHFGHCSSYTIFDVEDGNASDKKVIPNPGHKPGFLPGYLAEKGVDTVITGGMGPHAQKLFVRNKIDVILGIHGPLEAVIENFLKNGLTPGEDLCSQQHRQGYECGNHQSMEKIPAQKRCRRQSQRCNTTY